MAITPVQMVATLDGSMDNSNGSVRPSAFSASRVAGRDSGSAPISRNAVSTAPMNRIDAWMTSVQITAEMPPSMV